MARKILAAMKGNIGLLVFFAGIISLAWCNIAVPKIEKIFEEKQKGVNEKIVYQLNSIEKEIVAIKTELRLMRRDGKNEK